MVTKPHLDNSADWLPLMFVWLVKSWKYRCIVLRDPLTNVNIRDKRFVACGTRCEPNIMLAGKRRFGTLMWEPWGFLLQDWGGVLPNCGFFSPFPAPTTHPWSTTHHIRPPPQKIEKLIKAASHTERPLASTFSWWSFKITQTLSVHIGSWMGKKTNVEIWHYLPAYKCSQEAPQKIFGEKCFVGQTSLKQKQFRQGLQLQLKYNVMLFIRK